MLDAAKYSVKETLPRGRTVVIRAQRPDDREAIREALARASPDSLYRRFFAVKREFSEKEARYFLDIDFVKHVALVAVADENGRQAVVGGCRYIVVESGKAEVSFGVIDEYQGERLGTALMRHIAAIGREMGLVELVAEVLADNSAMLKVFEQGGLNVSFRHEGAVVHVTMRYR